MKTGSKIAYVPHPTQQRGNINVTRTKTEDGKDNSKNRTNKHGNLQEKYKFYSTFNLFSILQRKHTRSLWIIN